MVDPHHQRAVNCFQPLKTEIMCPTYLQTSLREMGRDHSQTNKRGRGIYDYNNEKMLGRSVSSTAAATLPSIHHTQRPPHQPEQPLPQQTEQQLL